MSVALSFSCAKSFEIIVKQFLFEKPVTFSAAVAQVKQDGRNRRGSDGNELGLASLHGSAPQILNPNNGG